MTDRKFKIQQTDPSLQVEIRPFPMKARLKFTGACPQWMEEGIAIAVEGYRSHYGSTGFRLERKDGGYCFTLHTDRSIEKDILVHLPDEGKYVCARKVSSEGAAPVYSF